MPVCICRLRATLIVVLTLLAAALVGCGGGSGSGVAALAGTGGDSSAGVTPSTDTRGATGQATTVVPAGAARALQIRDVTSAPGVTVSFSVTGDWGSGFGSSVVLKNMGTTAVQGWNLEWDFTPAVSTIWNAQVVSHVGTHYVLRGEGWNADIPAGKSVSFGFNGSPGGLMPAAVPTHIVVGTASSTSGGSTSGSGTSSSSGGSTGGSGTSSSSGGSTGITGSGGSGMSASIAYETTTDWGSGFGGSLAITNTGTARIAGWKLAFDFAPSITSAWNGSVVSHVGSRYVIQGAAWNADIAPGATVSVGFNGAPGGVTSGPGNFLLTAVDGSSTTGSTGGSTGSASGSSSGATTGSTSGGTTGSTSAGGSTGSTSGATGGSTTSGGGTGTVRGWPAHVAMGAITSLASNEVTAFANRPVDAIFKYSGSGGNGDPGQILYPLWTIHTVEQAQAITTATGRKAIPVMVDYTAEMSGGSSATDFQSPNVAMHLINLANDAQVLDPSGGSIVLNPDLLGMVEQNGLYSGSPSAAFNLSTMRIPVNASVAQAVCFMTKTWTWHDDQGNTFTGTQQQIARQMATKYNDASGWTVYGKWNTAALAWFASCQESPQVSMAIPPFTDDFKGWIQANAWIIKTFGPNTTFGWQENLWAPGSASWVHQGSGASYVQAAASNSVVTTLNTLEVYNGAHRPDFIVFDRYEMDDTAAISWGAFYNSTDWDNVLAFQSQVSSALGNVPVMMWQIPGGHLQVVGDVDTRTSHASTAPDYFFGDSALRSDLSNLKPYLAGITLGSPYLFDNGVTSGSLAHYLTMNGFNWTVDNNRLATAANGNVFAILWGGGNTTSVGVFPSDDNGWLAGKINAYYQHPQPVVPR